MSFCNRLKESRINAGLTQEQLSEKLGIAKSTLSGYESGKREPSVATIANILEILKIDANYLYQDECNFPIQVSYEEMCHIKKYRSLDSFGQETVNIILDREVSRLNQLQDASCKPDTSLRIYTYMRKIACAGTGFYFDDIPTDTIEAPFMEGADFIIGVSGESMEPDYHDGDNLYVKKTNHLSFGDVGIFTINNECFLKEYNVNGLVSLNKEYRDIRGDEDIRLVGKVIGKVTD